MTPGPFVRQRLADWPEGYSLARFRGRNYGVTLSRHAGGRSLKLYAEELGGPDFVSLNLYDTDPDHPTLRPCEMPVEKVLDFLRDAEPLAVTQ